MRGIGETEDGSKFQVRGSKLEVFGTPNLEPRTSNFELWISRIVVAEVCG